MNILKIKGTECYIYELNRFIVKHNIDEGDKFAISWRIKKKKKLRTYRLIRHRHWTCDSCGDITDVTLSKGSQTFALDNHLGSFSIRFS